MTRNQLKYIAVIAMLVDHVGWAFVPDASALGQLMHFVGRLTGPIMAYFIAEGYAHTRDVRRYMCRLAVFALVSWVPFTYFQAGHLPIYEVGGVPAFDPRNSVMFTFLLGLCAIAVWEHGTMPKGLRVQFVAILCVLSVTSDYAIAGVLWPLFFHVYRDRTAAKWTAYLVVAAAIVVLSLPYDPWYSGAFTLGFLVPPALLSRYDASPGRSTAWSKWFFYAIYPAHLLLLGLLR